jgi:hypothetical protein
MNIEVEYIDQLGMIHNQTHRMTRLAFAKHMAFAGQGYRIKPSNILRILGMFFHYSYYMQRQDFYNNNCFSLPPSILSDPTEQNQFSNIVGKAIADFLSKRINQSFLTLNYEAVAPRPLRGQRPDLVAFSQNAIFTLEAKGRGPNNPGNMANHKLQASSGNLPRHFSVACVSYNIYNSIKCNYHDPFNKNIKYNIEGLRISSANFYNNLSKFINNNYFEVEIVTYQNERFYEVAFSPVKLLKYFRNFDEYHFFNYLHLEFLDCFRPRLILPENIEEYAKNGLTRDTKPFNFDSKENNIYIDNDRIGLRIR